MVKQSSQWQRLALGRPRRTIQKIFVVGAGLMGAGIAQVSVQAGYEVWLHDANTDASEKAFVGVRERLRRKVDKGSMPPEKMDASMERLHMAQTLDLASDCDMVIEAIYESIEAKSAIFRKLEKVCKKEVVFASNTSSISITAMANEIEAPERLIGMHFFSPVPAMKLLEIIRGLRTTDEICDVARAVGERLGKVVVIAKDMPGFIVNRVLNPMLNEAIQILDEGIGNVESIDNGILYGCNHPMGPLALTDLVGVDILLAVMEVLYAELGDSKYRPAPLLRKMVRAGYLGKKSGAGFYCYDADGNRTGVNPVFT